VLFGGGNMTTHFTRKVSASLQRNAASQYGLLTQTPTITSSRRHNTELASYKKGRGGRSSFNGIVATVFGASGFLGRYVVNNLGKMGSQVIIPYRGTEYDVGHLKLMGDLGQVLYTPFYMRDEDSIRKAVQHSNVVINLIGRDLETKNFSYKDVNVTAAETIARICAEQGVEKLIHVSALNASEDVQPTLLNSQSQYLVTKAQGEEAVRAHFPDAIIMRPADMWGEEDRFFNNWASPYRRHLGMLPIFKRGESTVKQPVDVINVAQGICKAVIDKDTSGATFECVGPKSYYVADMVEYFYDEMRVGKMRIAPLEMMPSFWAKARFMNMLNPMSAYLHMDKLKREGVTDRLTGCPTLEDLGVQLTPMEVSARYFLKAYRENRYYLDSLGEVSHAAEPPSASEVDESRKVFF